MVFWSNFKVFVTWSTEFLFTPPFVIVTAILIGTSILTRWLGRRRLKQNWTSWHWLVFLQFLGFPTLVAIAVLGRVDAIPWPRQQPHMWAVWTSELVFWGCMAFGALCIWKMKHLGALAVVLFLWCQWLMQGAGFITSSALSGVWP
jgi:hypothetical protein